MQGRECEEEREKEEEEENLRKRKTMRGRGCVEERGYFLTGISTGF